VNSPTSPAAPLPLADRVALALDAAGHAPVTAVDFDRVTKAGWKVRVARSGATYVYAELPHVDPAQQDTLRAATHSSEAWRTAADTIDADRQAQRDGMLRAYATALRAEGFPTKLFDLGDRAARLRVEPLPPCGECGHIEPRHRDGRCVTCGVLRMNDPHHAYAPKEG
jgi:hypothetical protein